MVILHIYGDRAIFLLIYNQQDTESEKREIEIGVFGPMFIQKKKPESLWD